MIARPKISRNERKATELGAFEVGHVAPFSCPGGDPALGSHILNLESKAKILEDMLAAANGAAPELQQ